MSRFISLLIVMGLVSMVLTYVLYRFFKGKRVVKYIPSLLSLLYAGYNLYLSQTVHNNGFEDLARAGISLLFFGCFVCGILTCIVLDFRISKAKK